MMKSLIGISVFSALAGLVLGAALAYVEVGQLTPSHSESAVDVPEKPDLRCGSNIEVPETTYEFGSMEFGTSLSHDFILRNTGTEPVTVKIGSTTCKCTVGNLAEGETAEIAPGSETEVTLQWHARTSPGPFRHGATLLTSDPRRSRVELTVEGTIVESTAMSPSELIFGVVGQGESKQAELTLMAFLEDEVQIVDYHVDDEQLAEHVQIRFEPIEASDAPSPETKSAVKVIADFDAGKKLGPFYGTLHMTTNLKKAQHLEVPLAGTVVGDISVFGPGWNTNSGVLRMGPIHSDKGKSVQLHLNVRGDQAASIVLSVAEVDPPEMKVAVGEAIKVSDQLYRVPLTIEIPKGTRPMVRAGEPISDDALVLLKSSRPDTPELGLRVRFTVQP